MNNRIRIARLVPSGELRTGFKSSLSAVSEKVGGMTVRGTFSHVQVPDSFGAEYRPRGRAGWTCVTDRESPVGTVALTIDGLAPGQTFDVRLFWTLDGVHYPMRQSVTCRVMASEAEVGDSGDDNDTKHNL